MKDSIVTGTKWGRKRRNNGGREAIKSGDPGHSLAKAATTRPEHPSCFAINTTYARQEPTLLFLFTYEVRCDKSLFPSRPKAVSYFYGRRDVGFSPS